MILSNRPETNQYKVEVVRSLGAMIVRTFRKYRELSEPYTMHKYCSLAALAMVALASGFTVSPVGTKLNAARTAKRVALAPVMAEEPDSKEVAIGAAWIGGLGGVYLFGQLSTALVIATAFSYGSTLNNGFGDLCKK